MKDTSLLIVTELISGSTYDLLSVFFTGNNTGYAVGESATILATTNGGVTWSKITLPNEVISNITSVYFCDANNGLAVAKEGFILKTVDAGATWILKTQPHEFHDLFSVIYKVSNNGWTVGESEIVLSPDGGITWTKVSDTGFSLNSVFFMDRNTGYSVGMNALDSKGIILKTVDGGITWTIVRENIDDPMNSIFFPNRHTGYAVGNNGTIFKLEY